MPKVPGRRRTAVVLFVAITAVASAMLVPVLSGHLAVARTDRIDATATDATVLEDGDRVQVTLRLDNPTTAAVTVPERPSEAGLALFDGEARITDPRGVDVGGARLPAGESATLTVTMAVTDDHSPVTRDRIVGTDLTGSLTIEVVGYETQIDVDAAVRAA
ncbi:hypothetical protein [Halobaculum limi]|uniref:hypothetical protein n=1 Tax=Halobaculum limi TaxID=3031916 RepID=UPI002404E437|nr:hypothetical protein [Halobaculum sp. YSMS11]